MRSVKNFNNWMLKGDQDNKADYCQKEGNKHPIFYFIIIVKLNERSSYLIYT